LRRKKHITRGKEMKKAFKILLCVVLIIFGIAFVNYCKVRNRSKLLLEDIVPPPVVEVMPKETAYQIASRITGCPEYILIGIDFAESSCGKNIVHPDPNDKGRFGIHDSEDYRAERVAKYGYYDPDNFLSAAILTGRLFMDNYKLLGNTADAICAHKQGLTGVRRDGRAEWYLERVLNPVIS
jgi:hypothetical protein